MLKFLAKAAVVTGVTYLLDKCAELFNSNSSESLNPNGSSPIPIKRKKHDTTKFTQYNYDIIIMAHHEFKRWNSENPTSRKTTFDLTALLNEKFNLDKSRTAYANVWNDHINRNLLPTGVNP